MSRSASTSWYFAIVSGENADLARIEIETLLQMVDPKYEVSWHERVAIIEGLQDPTDFLLQRAALLKEAGTIVFETDSLDGAALEIPDDLLKSCVGSNETFSIRTKSFLHGRNPETRKSIVVELGDKIQRTTAAKVHLENPDIQVLVLVMSDRVLICMSKESQLRGQLRRRRPGKKPFFHPSMMNALLARTMCNLARVMPNETVLDPFCGGGGILCEIAYIGAKPIGLELNWRLLRGASMNLASIQYSNYSLIQGDARYPPIRNCHHVVTDPPYGRASSTRGEKAGRLVTALFENAEETILPGGSMCTCHSSGMGVPEIIRQLGFEIEYQIQFRVHSGLVREVITINL
jgi:tRNA (guanine10-N2)-dimethyltransferase